MTSRSEDHSTYREMLDVALDASVEAGAGASPDPPPGADDARGGEALSAEARRRLEAHLADCEECRSRREETLALHGLLGAARLPVGPEFTERVMTALPPAPWESRSAARRGFLGPLNMGLLQAAVLALLVVGASLAVGVGASGLAAGDSVASAAGALAALLATSLVAGAGLLGASFQGLGLVVEGTLATSASGWAAMIAVVLFANLLFWSLVRRPAPAGSVAGSSGGAEDEPR